MADLDGGKVLDKGSTAVIAKAAHIWYDQNPLMDDFTVEDLTIDQMRGLIKKDRGKWRETFIEELLRRGYHQYVYYEVRYEDGSGDEHAYLLLLPEDEGRDLVEDLSFVSDSINDHLLNVDFDSVDYQGEAQDETFWEKDSLMGDVCEQLERSRFKADGVEKDHYWTKYKFTYDGMSFVLAQTYKTRVGVVIDGKVKRLDDVYVKADPVLKKALPDFFPKRSTWWTKILYYGNFQFP